MPFEHFIIWLVGAVVLLAGGSMFAKHYDEKYPQINWDKYEIVKKPPEANGFKYDEYIIVKKKK